MCRRPKSTRVSAVELPPAAAPENPVKGSLLVPLSSLLPGGYAQRYGQLCTWHRHFEFTRVPKFIIVIEDTVRHMTSEESTFSQLLTTRSHENIPLLFAPRILQTRIRQTGTVEKGALSLSLARSRSRDGETSCLSLGSIHRPQPLLIVLCFVLSTRQNWIESGSRTTSSSRMQRFSRGSWLFSPHLAFEQRE